MTEPFAYRDADTECEGTISLPAGASSRRPAVLVFHNWAGQTDIDTAAAERLAGQGYVGIAADVYGRGRRGDLAGDNSALMMPFMADRAMLRQRLLAAVDAAAAHPAVDPDAIAVIGYCFGGLCALDVARAAPASVKLAASFHGNYMPSGLLAERITAKVLVLHGWNDPITPPDATVALAHELNAAGADWQIHVYGHTYHAFTNRGAANPAGGFEYSATADSRSWRALSDLLTETFG